MNEQQKLENLLKPRIIVTALWPFCRQHNNMEDQPKIGEIFHVSDGGSISNDAMTIMSVYKYPHLFRILEWWEERTPEEMPEYVKPLNPEEYHHQFGNVVLKVDKKTSGLHQFHATNLFQLAAMHWSKWLPATEAEYLAHNQQPQH